MATRPIVEACAKSAGQRLREALAELVRQQISNGAPQPPTATALCELAGVSRNALYRYHPDVLEELHKLQRQRRGDPGPAKQETQQLREENKELRYQVTALAALVDHYFAAWQETRTLLERRERELAELRRNIKPNSSSAEQLFVPDQTVTVVQEQAGEHLVRIAVQARLQIGAGGLGAVQDVPCAQLFAQVTAAHLKHRLQLGVLRLPEPFAPAEALLVGREQAPEPLELQQQVPRKVNGTLARYPGAQEDRQQLGI